MKDVRSETSNVKRENIERLMEWDLQNFKDIERSKRLYSRLTIHVLRTHRLISHCTNSSAAW